MSTDVGTGPARRGLAIAFGLCALAMLLLLGSHPSGGGGALADILKQEAQNQLADRIVHGGMVLVLTALIVCFVLLELPADLAMAKTSLILLGTIIRFLMPMGLLFQAVAMLGLSSVIVTGAGLRRIVGMFGVAAAIAIIGATLAVPALMAGHVMLGCILLLAIWYFTLALVLFNGRSWS